MSRSSALKTRVFGGVLAGLGAASVLLAAALGFEPDPFYFAMSAAGVGLLLHATMRR